VQFKLNPVHFLTTKGAISYKTKRRSSTFSFKLPFKTLTRYICIPHGEESIISLICDITWAGKKTTDENGSVWQGTYKFNKNGTYTRTNIEIDKQGNKKEANIYGQWSFGDPSFSTIYFGGEHYWDIDELTKNKFSFYDRSGKFGDPFMNREYIELTPYQENNTTN
jgi:hypothetical protein